MGDFQIWEEFLPKLEPQVLSIAIQQITFQYLRILKIKLLKTQTYEKYEVDQL